MKKLSILALVLLAACGSKKEEAPAIQPELTLQVDAAHIDTAIHLEKADTVSAATVDSLVAAVPQARIDSIRAEVKVKLDSIKAARKALLDSTTK